MIGANSRVFIWISLQRVLLTKGEGSHNSIIRLFKRRINPAFKLQNPP